jgi:hypothetical protein
MIPKSKERWLGIHLLMRSNEEMIALVEETPRLAALGINVLFPEMNYDFAYDSHPELRSADAITKANVHRLVKACREHQVRLIPQFQCLGHQSWAETTFPLLIQYPEFDETPGQFPENQGIYCRSWCTQHPQVNPIIFDLFDELLEVFEADALHVGMDEVFLIGSEFCPRCQGKDPAALFAKAVNDYYAHLVQKRGVEMLMWADRLLDGDATGYGKWEAATNGTAPAVDMIPKDIILCDWHYTLREDYPSIPFFLERGFRVLPGGWREVEATQALITYAGQHKTPQMLGHLCTTWGSVKPGALADWPPIRKAQELV